MVCITLDAMSMTFIANCIFLIVDFINIYERQVFFSWHKPAGCAMLLFFGGMWLCSEVGGDENGSV